MEIEKPGKFTRYKGKLVIWKKDTKVIREEECGLN